MHLGQDSQTATHADGNDTTLSETETSAETRAFSEALLDAYTSSCSQNALQNMDTNGVPSDLIDLYAQLDDVPPLNHLAQVGTEQKMS